MQLLATKKLCTVKILIDNIKSSIAIKKVTKDFKRQYIKNYLI